MSRSAGSNSESSKPNLGARSAFEKRRLHCFASSSDTPTFGLAASGFDSITAGLACTVARGGGADGFLFWNAGSSYGMVQRAMVNEARGLAPFDIPADRAEARSLFGG